MTNGGYNNNNDNLIEGFAGLKHHLNIQSEFVEADLGRIKKEKSQLNQWLHDKKSIISRESWDENRNILFFVATIVYVQYSLVLCKYFFIIEFTYAKDLQQAIELKCDRFVVWIVI